MKQSDAVKSSGSACASAPVRQHADAPGPSSAAARVASGAETGDSAHAKAI
jgi:hypothetical protein